MEANEANVVLDYSTPTLVSKDHSWINEDENHLKQNKNVSGEYNLNWFSDLKEMKPIQEVNRAVKEKPYQIVLFHFPEWFSS